MHVATAEDRGRGASALETAVTGVDAFVTATPGLVLAVLVADCVPLVLYDADTPAVGIAHAGWRGTVAHVARATVEAMTSAFGTDPGRLRVALGPSIGPESYEVGGDVAARAREEFAKLIGAACRRQGQVAPRSAERERRRAPIGGRPARADRDGPGGHVHRERQPLLASQRRADGSFSRRRRSPRRLALAWRPPAAPAGGSSGRSGLKARAHVEIAEQPVVEAVDHAVHRQLLAACPRVLDDRRLAHVRDLLDHVELAQALEPLRAVERRQLARMPLGDVLTWRSQLSISPCRAPSSAAWTPPQP